MTLFGAFHDTNFADSLFRVQDLRLPCRLRLATVVNSREVVRMYPYCLVQHEKQILAALV